MERRLFSEVPELYYSTKVHPNTIQLRIKMRDPVDPVILRRAVDTTMERYPYFCVELRRNDRGEWFFTDNDRPVVVRHALTCADLNSADTNYHMIAFWWFNDQINMDVFHGMTDGTGVYEVIRTLLYYYCSERYDVCLPGEGIRLVGDTIPDEEWMDPIASLDLAALNKSAAGGSSAAINGPAATNATASRNAPAPGKVLDLIKVCGLEDDHCHTVYSIAASESEFMQFNIENDGSPATMVSLFLSRAIAKLFPDCPDPIRVRMFVDMRPALQVPSAHHSLVTEIVLEYKDRIRDMPIDRQATMYRGMVYAQTMDEKTLEDAASMREFAQQMISQSSDLQRLASAEQLVSDFAATCCAAVSYIGRANFGDAESHLRDFRLLTCTNTQPLLLEITAMGGRFTFDVIQQFSSPIIVNALLEEFERNGIRCELQGMQRLELANVALPWTT